MVGWTGGTSFTDQSFATTVVAGILMHDQQIAAGVNPADWQNRKSGQRCDPNAATGSPTILGIDGVGVVEAIGDAVQGIKVADEVWYIDGGYPGNPGSYAEYKVAHGAYVSKKPSSLDFVQAFALPVVGLTAWEAVSTKASFSPATQSWCMGARVVSAISRSSISRGSVFGRRPRSRVISRRNSLNCLPFWPYRRQREPDGTRVSAVTSLGSRPVAL
jgi:hypothetical protein